MNLHCLLFDNFETLDLFGPVEVFGMVEDCVIQYFSMKGGIITSRHHAPIVTEPMDAMIADSVLLVPGGQGTRALVNDGAFIGKLKSAAEASQWCLTVCTGSALLAKTGLLDHCSATSNKMAFDWVKSHGENARWKYQARWVVDKKYYTSAGISAGIDMSLGFIFDRFGEKKAKEIAQKMEYEWNSDKNNDPFSI